MKCPLDNSRRARLIAASALTASNPFNFGATRARRKPDVRYRSCSSGEAHFGFGQS